MNLDVRDLVKIRAEQPGLVAERAAARRVPSGLAGTKLKGCPGAASPAGSGRA